MSPPPRSSEPTARGRGDAQLAILALREGADGQQPGFADPTNHADDAAEDEPRSRRVLVCSACQHEITHTDTRIQKAGRHQHTCVNPSGHVYRIGCFREAPGSIGVGEWSDLWSWFADHVWQVACCARCSAHLGWGFQGEDGQFHGLILDRLVERSDESAAS